MAVRRLSRVKSSQRWLWKSKRYRSEGWDSVLPPKTHWCKKKSERERGREKRRSQKSVHGGKSTAEQSGNKPWHPGRRRHCGDTLNVWDLKTREKERKTNNSKPECPRMSTPR